MAANKNRNNHFPTYLSSITQTKKKKKKPRSDVAASKTAVNYTLFDQKITFDFLKSHLWAAAEMSSKPESRRYGNPPIALINAMIISTIFSTIAFLISHAELTNSLCLVKTALLSSFGNLLSTSPSTFTVVT
jgi:hypothetical protein